ncbi:AAA family ATPase [Chloroflexota bacterium]
MLNSEKIIESVASFNPAWKGQATSSSYIFKLATEKMEVRFYNILQERNLEFSAKVIVFNYNVKKDALWRTRITISDDYHIETHIASVVANAVSSHSNNSELGHQIGKLIMDLVKDFSHALNKHVEEGARIKMVGIRSLVENLPKKKVLIENFVNQGEVIMIYAPSGKGASTLLLNMVLCCWTATSFIGFKIPKPLRVGYWQFEGSPWETLERLETMAKSFNNFDIDLIPCQREYERQLSDPDARATWRNLILDHELDILVPDDFSSFRGAFDENNANDMSTAGKLLGNIAAGTGCAIVFPHHTGKATEEKRTGRLLYPYSYRGSSEIEGKVDGAFRFVPDAERPKDMRLLESVKLRATAKSEVRKALVYSEDTLIVREALLSEQPVSEAERNTEEAPFFSPEDIRRLREKCSMTQKQFADRVGTHEKTVYRWEHNDGTPQAEHRKRLKSLEDSLNKQDKPDGQINGQSGHFKGV